MYFSLQGLGRLQEATVDLSKDLILLTGKNNTHKTYVTHAIYGLLANLSSLIRIVVNTQLPGATLAPYIKNQRSLDLGAVLDDHARAMLERLGPAYQGQLASVFAAHPDFARSAIVRLYEAPWEDAWALARRRMIDRSFAIGGRSLSFAKAGGSTLGWITERPQPQTSESAQPTDEEIHELFNSGIGLCFESTFFRIANPRILAAERSAIQLFSRELSLKRSEILDETLALALGKRDPLNPLVQRARRYPQAIRDGLRIADDRANLGKRVSRPMYVQIAEQLEQDVLGGAVRAGEDGELLFAPREGGELGMHLSSSSVKALSDLVFYLRHLAVEGDLLVIDEPELNLHPDNQRLVARALARIVRAGIKVMVTTHSDYLLREINNLIMLSRDKDGAMAQRHGYRSEESLLPEQIGAYLFGPERAQVLEVHPYGVEVEPIDQEINRLNVTAQDLYFELIERK